MRSGEGERWGVDGGGIRDRDKNQKLNQKSDGATKRKLENSRQLIKRTDLTRRAKEMRSSLRRGQRNTDKRRDPSAEINAEKFRRHKRS